MTPDPARLPDPPQKPAPSVEGVAVTLTAAAALMPTLLSAQGMISVGADVLGLAVAVALSLAVFLELALVSSVLLARAAVFRGRSSAGRPAVDMGLLGDQRHVLRGPRTPRTRR